MVKPNLKLEREIIESGYDLVIGVDEVGRGALAGSVVAGAVAIQLNSKHEIRNSKQIRNSNFENSKLVSDFDIRDSDFWLNLGIDDSKRLTARKRTELDKIIRKNSLWGIGEVGVTTINKIGIVKATEKAMRLAVAKIKKGKTFVLIDAFHVKYVPGVGLSNQKGIIKGDQKVLSIAAASIIAKVYRDETMRNFSKKLQFKKYKWDKNKGYGTADHIAAIRKNGLTRLHRLAFVKNIH